MQTTLKFPTKSLPDIVSELTSILLSESTTDNAFQDGLQVLAKIFSNLNFTDNRDRTHKNALLGLEASNSTQIIEDGCALGASLRRFFMTDRGGGLSSPPGPGSSTHHV